MDDLAETVISKLRVADGDGEISILQDARSGAQAMLITPVTTDGSVSFDIRLAFHLSELVGELAEGFNFPDVESTVDFAFNHARVTYKNHNQTHIRFVGTAMPNEGPTHMSISTDEPAQYEAVLRTLARMRPLQHK